MTSYALHSTMSFKRDRVSCSKPWPNNCFVQSGDMQKYQDYARLKGIETREKRFFFEAFPRNPDYFVRGEGDTFEQAEDDCWKKYQSIADCPGHEFDRRGRKDGYAFCKNCALSGVFLEPLTKCAACGQLTSWAEVSMNGEYVHYCRKHWWALPVELWDEPRRYWDSIGIKTLSELDDHMLKIESSDIRNALEEVTIAVVNDIDPYKDAQGSQGRVGDDRR